MLKKRKAAAMELQSRLLETETAIDEAISKMADLTGYMPVARESANLSAIVGQDAIAQAASTLSALIDARGQIVETHHRLAEARDSIGLRTMAMGAGNVKPPQASAENSNDDGENVVEIAEKAA